MLSLMRKGAVKAFRVAAQIALFYSIIYLQNQPILNYISIFKSMKFYKRTVHTALNHLDTFSLHVLFRHLYSAKQLFTWMYKNTTSCSIQGYLTL